MRRRLPWLELIRLSRPLFLLAGIGLHLLGAAYALSRGAPLNLSALLLGQLGVTSIQLMTHLANEYWDLEGDRLIQQRTPFTGGSGVLVAGGLSPAYALGGARLLLAIGLTAGVGLALLLGSPWPALIALLGAGTGWGYSAPPLRLSARGLGEAATGIVVGLLVPAMGYAALAGGVPVEVATAGAVLTLLMTAAMVTIEVPDYPADVESGKWNWVARLGPRRAWRVYRLLMLSAALVLVVSVARRWLPGTSLLGLAYLAAWLGAEAFARRPGGTDSMWLPGMGIAGVALGAAGVYLGLILG